MKATSLSQKLGKRISAELLIFTTIMGVILSAFLYLHEKSDMQHQVDVWLDTFPKSILPHLIDSDHFQVTGKVKMLQGTGLFKSLSVVDRLKNPVASFNAEKKATSVTPSIPIVDSGGETWGYYSFEVNWSLLLRPIIVSLVVVSLLVGLIWITRRRLKQGIQTDFQEFSQFLDQLEEFSESIASADKNVEKNLKFRIPSCVDEEKRINHVIGLLVREIRKQQERVIEYTRSSLIKKHEEERFREARQIAHDLRTPAEALRTIVDELSMVPEEKRTHLREATGTILDMTNDLYDRYSEVTTNGKPGEKARSVELLSPIIERVISRKRLLCDKNPDISIKSELGPDSYEFFARIHKTDFRRALTNLLNNAVEALDGRGQVIVQATRSAGEIAISVRDNGKGISAKDLPEVIKEGVSIGKNGLGVGLSQSKDLVEKWGGSLKIESEPGQGTTVTIILPREKPPWWYVPELAVNSETQIVVVDDDPSIHYVWKRALQPLHGKLKNSPVHFRTALEFREWLKTQDGRTLLCLIDFEFLKEKTTGIEVIRDSKIEGSSILVTSRSEESQVMSAAKELGVRMLPKEMVRHLPVRFLKEHDRRFVLLDDNHLTREVWEDSAQDHGVALKIFASPETMMLGIGALDLDTEFYIDHNLGAGKASGIDVARELYSAGFRNIYLATATREDQVTSSPWIRAIVGKQPPWAKQISQRMMKTGSRGLLNRSNG